MNTVFIKLENDSYGINILKSKKADGTSASARAV